MVTPWSWMSCRAVSGSNRPSGMTSFTPAIIPTTRLLWQPDTWNSGRGQEADGLAAAGRRATAASGSAIAVAIVLKIVFWRLATMLRWVEMAPLGRPVVPDV